jgi:hypothetical protein
MLYVRKLNVVIRRLMLQRAFSVKWLIIVKNRHLRKLTAVFDFAQEKAIAQ